MDAGAMWPWAALLLLGAAHGINPGMGWLFAVALGMQEQERRAVWRALLPLAAGHTVAIAGTIAVAGMLGLALPVGTLKWLVAATLFGVGVMHLIRHRHPRWGGMRVGARDLTVWSALMATAHGAGLMALPFVLRASADATAADGGAHAGHAAMVHTAGLAGGAGVGLWATAVHTLGYLSVTGVVAVVVYEKVGLRALRRAWVNLDVLWAGALVVTAVLTLRL
ncbi:MAG TPA: hypothetical protein VNS52_00135 [Gemmatimonadaceae bacterium]|nr:hypothetical protein [Gemmatimonadaceae bacterium]